MDTQAIIQVKEIINQSPLREIIINQLKSPVTMDEALLEQESKKMNQLIDSMNTSLKVVIMGEVKAGKSTLLNAIAGSDISPTDIAEATGTVIEIKYHPDPYGKIIFTDKTIEDNPEAIFTILQENNNNQDFFQDCLGVEFGFPNTSLQEFTLVDTPGLETITEENSDRTKDYLSKTDVVIWVFNGHHLGQSDIEDALIEVNRYGKPIIAVINRKDEIEEDPEVLVDYLDEEIGMFVEEIQAISAYQATQGRMNNNPELLNESGFLYLMDYIKTNISNHSDDVKKDVIVRSAQALLNRDILIHEEYLKTIHFLEEQTENMKEQITSYSERILDHIQYNFESWFDRKFLLEEQEHLKSTIRESGYFKLKENKKDVDQHLHSIFSQEYLSEKLNEHLKLLDEEYEAEWAEAIEKVKSNILLEMNKFQQESEQQLDVMLHKGSNSLVSGESDLLEGTTKGVALGGATGAAYAFYAAALGPAASTVTIGMAASALLPPALIIGASIGAVSSAIKFKKDKKVAEQSIDEIFKNAKEDMKQDVLKAVKGKYKAQNNQVKENVNQSVVSSLTNGMEAEVITKLKQRLQSYVYEIKRQSEELKLVHL